MFFESRDPQFILKSNEREAWIVHYIVGGIPPLRLGVLLGECVFQMRSALDNLVCGLIRTADPCAPCEGTQFPIASTSDRWEGSFRKHLRGIEPAAQKMIRDLQPCYRSATAPEGDPLAILNRLCNSDKHRAVTLTIAYSHDLMVRVHGRDGEVYEWKATEPLYAASVHSIPIGLNPLTVQPSARVEVRGTGVLTIQDVGPWGLRSVWSVLADLHKYVVDQVIIPLKPFFLAPPGSRAKR